MDDRRTAPGIAPRSPRATWALTCALVAAVSLVPFVPIPFGAFVFGTGAVVLGALGKRDGAAGMRGTGMAIAAVALGAVSIVVGVIQIVRSF